MLALSSNLCMQARGDYDTLNRAADEISVTGVNLARVYSFNGAGDGRPGGKSPAEWLRDEPVPRRLALVTVADNYGNGAQTGAEIIAVDSREAPMTPEKLREQLLELLAQYARPTWRQAPNFCAVLAQMGIAVD